VIGLHFKDTLPAILQRIQ